MYVPNRNEGDVSTTSTSSSGRKVMKISVNKLVIPASFLLVYLCISPFMLLSHETSTSKHKHSSSLKSPLQAPPAPASTSSDVRSDVRSDVSSEGRPNSNGELFDPSPKRRLTQIQPPSSSSSSSSSSISSIIQSASNLIYNTGTNTFFFNNKTPQPDPEYQTGSFANCTYDMATSTPPSRTKPVSSHPDASVVYISCREIHFRAPLSTIEKGGIPIVVGVLSGAGGKGPIHRDSIRATWARDRKGVYFIVAGPWEDIEEEYNDYRDLIWIDEEEIYEGEESVLPFKTETFLYIMNKYTLEGKAGFEYLFKTDDDSYVDLTKLENELLGKDDVYYWGCCTDNHFKPLRHISMKWRISFELYPEEYYPKYVYVCIYIYI